MNKIELNELIAETNPDNLDFLPGNVRKEIDELKGKIDEVCENSKVIKEYQIPQYNHCDKILIIEE